MNVPNFPNNKPDYSQESWKETVVRASRPVRIAATVALSLLAVWLLVDTIQGISNFIQTNDDSGNTIVVTGEGTATAIPDTASISFGDTVTAPDAATAEGKMTTVINAAISAVEAEGVSKDDISTTDYSVSPHYSEPVCTPGAFCPATAQAAESGFDVSEMVEVKVHDITKVSAVLGDLTKAGITNVSGPEYVVGDSQAPMQQARAMAIQKAQADAKVLAAQLGEHLGKMSDFEDNTGGNTTSPAPVERAMGAMDATAVPNPSVPVGSNTFTDDVSITYYVH
jgi:uncharacterized protein YggE